jgi:hypothetical protein
LSSADVRFFIYTKEKKKRASRNKLHGENPFLIVNNKSFLLPCQAMIFVLAECMIVMPTSAAEHLLRSAGQYDMSLYLALHSLGNDILKVD